MSANLLMEPTPMHTTPFIDDLIRERRSKRGFIDRAVPLDVVKDILSVASMRRVRATRSHGAAMS
jgi:hypothetical protein